MVSELTSEREKKSPAAIFISYSRSDAAFVDLLQADLARHGFRPVVDRTDIYAFEEWWKRIETLITNADTIIFVISPDAVASPICSKEIAFAATLKKRFAPIICRPTEMAQVPDVLARFNIISFVDSSHFAENADRLAEALTTNIDWIRSHTRYGELALRWSAAGRPGPKGMLLRSPLLEEAERWIASRPQGAPVPTEATQNFIAASRTAETRRRKTLIAGLAAGLCFAFAFTGYALVQKHIADRESLAARKSLVESLSAQSGLELSRYDHVGALQHALAASSVETTFAAAGQARASDAPLRAALSSNRLILHMRRPPVPPLWPFEFIDERRLAYTTNDGGLFAVDLQDRKLLWHIQLSGIGRPEILVVARDAARIVVAGAANIAIVDRATKKVTSRADLSGQIRAIDIQTQHGQVAVALDRSLVFVDPSSDSTERITIQVPDIAADQRIRHISFDRRATRLYIAIGDDFGRHARLVRYNLDTRSFTPVAATDPAILADETSELYAYQASEDALVYWSRIEKKFGIFTASDGAVFNLRDELSAVERTAGGDRLYPVGLHYADYGGFSQLFAISRSSPQGDNAMTIAVHMVTQTRQLQSVTQIKYRPRDSHALIERCRVSDAHGFLACYYSTAAGEGIAVWDLADGVPSQVPSEALAATAKTVLTRLTVPDTPRSPFGATVGLLPAGATR